MVLAFGMVCALLEAQRSGKGQVVDASMVEGSAALMAMIHSFAGSGMHTTERGTNMLDGGAHFYDTYETKDEKYISIGSIEPQFYALLIEKAQLDPQRFAPQMDRSQWDELKQELTRVFKTKTREEWCELMEGTDVCFAPVLSYAEAPDHPHNRSRGSYIELDGVVQPGPVPKFSRTVAQVQAGPRRAGQDTATVLRDFGLGDDEVAALREEGALS